MRGVDRVSVFEKRKSLFLSDLVFSLVWEIYSCVNKIPLYIRKKLRQELLYDQSKIVLVKTAQAQRIRPTVKAAAAKPQPNSSSLRALLRMLLP